MKQIILFLVCVSPCAFSQIFESGDKQVTLIELYTSEGCSSCPPADRWLSNLGDDKRLWRNFVPIAFHVDYWNQLGWKDRFSDAKFSDRQREYHRQGKTSAVYTPGFVTNGKEWRKWFRSKDAVIPRTSKTPGNLKIEINDSLFSAEFHPTRSNLKSARLNLALLGMNLNSKVTRGENHGRVLKHDFVVLSYKQLSPSSSFAWEGQIPKYSATLKNDKTMEKTNKDTDKPQLAIVTWISEASKPDPIQVAGGFLN